MTPDEIENAVDRKDMSALRRLTSEEANRKGWDGYTPLMYAMLTEDPDPVIVAQLIARGADVNTAENGQRWTPLHFAARTQNKALVRLLLEAGAEVDPTDVFGDTPLWRSVMNSNPSLQAMKLLLRYGADPRRRNLHGISPLDLARESGQHDVVSLLESRGHTAE